MNDVDQDVVVMYTLVKIFSNFLKNQLWKLSGFLRVLKVFEGFEGLESFEGFERF